ncbi:purine-binding chemotaxis protein CheW [bacterium]|nr:purine-binding chemotaxis protein CheW [bacterium]
MKKDGTKPASPAAPAASELSEMFAVSDSMKKQLLRIRAQELAVESVEEEHRSDTIDVVEFELAHERYGIESRWVKEVFPLRELTPVPCTPSFILGITSIRGQIIPVMDIKTFFDLPSTSITNLNRLMILRGEEMHVGILADVIESVRELEKTDIHEKPGGRVDKRHDYIKGVTKDHLIILDAKKILTDPDIKVNEDV